MTYLKNILLAVMLLVLAACNSGNKKEELLKGSKPNIIFILADDMGYGDLGCYGQEIVKTPTIDKMAVEGLRFTQFYAGGPVCSSSRASLMTGLNNGNTSIKTMERPLDDEDITLGEVLKEAGYHTGVIGKWGMGGAGTAGLPNAQGFDFSYGYYSHIRAHNSYPDYMYRDGLKDSLDNEVIYITDSSHYAVGIGNAAVEKRTYSNDVFTKEGLEFMDKAPEDAPFFLYMAYTIPHANNESWLINECGMEVPDYGIYKDEDWPEAKKAGASMISYLDSYVATILEYLEENGLDDNTLILFSSDNGPHGEGGWSPDFFDSNSIYRGMKRDIYEGGIRVPFIAYWPGKIEAGHNEQVFAFWDILPTFCDLAGVETPDSDGDSFVRTLQGENVEYPGDTLYWEFRTPNMKQGVRIGDWKAIRIQDYNKPSYTELYKLSDDITEQNNLADIYPEKVKDFEKVMDQYN